MGRALFRHLLSCLLAWALVAPSGPASAIVKHCQYSVFVSGSGNNGNRVEPTPVGLKSGGAIPVDYNRITAKGRVRGTGNDARNARDAAMGAALECVTENMYNNNLFACENKLYFPPSQSVHYGQVLDWKMGSLRHTAIDTVCSYAGGLTIQQINVFVLRDEGWSSDCDANHTRRLFDYIFFDDVNFCAARPVPVDPTGGVGQQASGRPLPADPTGGLPPPPGHGLTAAPDLKLVKTAGQNACLPNRQCKFKVKVINDGLGPFKGPLTITDTVTPASERLTDFGPVPWNCTGRSGEYTCRHPNVNLAPGQSMELSLAFMNTEKARGTVKNCARIDWQIPPLEGLCTAAIEEALAREREKMDVKTASETEKAVKEYQCKAGVEQTGKPDAALLRMAFKSIGMGDTNRDNDVSCAASSLDLPEPETVSVTPESMTPAGTACTGGRFRSRSTGECLCPSARPAWDGTACQPRGTQATAPPPPAKPVTASPVPATPACTGGRYWDHTAKACRCPADRPLWSGKDCRQLVIMPPPGSPPTTRCSGGREFDAVARRCKCPPDKPVWFRQSCRAPGSVTAACPGGQVWDAKRKSCQCPSDKPVWDDKYNRCEQSAQTGPVTGPSTASPTYTPPSTTAPAATAPSKLVCRGGKVAGALCWCGIGKFPKKVGNNVYQCR